MRPLLARASRIQPSEMEPDEPESGAKETPRNKVRRKKERFPEGDFAVGVEGRPVRWLGSSDEATCRGT
jgi:hypothetical protein